MCDEFLMGCTLLTAFVHLCVLFSGILVHFSGYINRLCRHTVESDCVFLHLCPIICKLAVWQI